MAFSDIPNKLESVFIQRNSDNAYYHQINISGSDLIIYHDETGSINADKIDTFSKKYSIGVYTKVSTITANYTASISDEVIFVNNTGVNVLLPSAPINSGKKYTVKLISAGTAKVSGSLGNNIDSQIGYDLSSQYKYVSVVSNGTQWYIVANN